MKVILAASALALMASGAQAQQTAMDYALAQNPVPCNGAENIESAEFHIETKGARILRVTCKKRGGLFAGGPGTAAAGAPATGFVPAVGLLGPLLGIGAAGAAVALAGGDGGSSTSDTQ